MRALVAKGMASIAACEISSFATPLSSLPHSLAFLTSFAFSPTVRLFASSRLQDERPPQSSLICYVALVGFWLVCSLKCSLAPPRELQANVRRPAPLISIPGGTTRAVVTELSGLER